MKLLSFAAFCYREQEKASKTCDQVGLIMRILKIDPAGTHSEAIYATASILKSGGLVLYPTETFYALGALPGVVEAVEKVFEIKGRDEAKPLPVIASDIQAVRRVASEWCESAGALAESFWPGPLSIVIPAVESLTAVLHAVTGKIAVRVCSHPVAAMLARACGGLIVSTSANRAGEPPPASPGNIAERLLLAVDALLDAGNLPGGLPSTIVDVTVQPAVLVRAGKINWENIQPVFGRIGQCSY